MSLFDTCKLPFAHAEARLIFPRFFSDTCYHLCEGHDATSHASFGEAVHIAVTLNMHEEASYEGLDPIETEIRRRVFWLLFGGRSSPPLSSSVLFGNVDAHMLNCSGQINVDSSWPPNLSEGRGLHVTFPKRGRR